LTAKCRKHNDSSLDMFCVDWELIVCQKCALNYHNGHKHSTMNRWSDEKSIITTQRHVGKEQTNRRSWEKIERSKEELFGSND
jgi:ribosome-binding protein aMBF1 (putative translation factor)